MSDEHPKTDEVMPENTKPDGTGPQEVPETYVPEPRGEARIAGIDPEAVDARLAECSEFFRKHCDEADYRNLDWYLWRMQLKYAVGDDIYEIVDDAFLAARCLHDRHAMHLELKPPEMFMTRRITPVELGIISGMPMLTLEFSATYGLPLMMVLGKTAPDDVMEEANLMTSYFRRGFCADFVELTGLSAVIYAGVIAAIGRGFDDEAAVGLNTYAKARDSLRGMPPKALLPKIKRYDALNTALACLCAGNIDMIGEILAPEAEAFAAEQARRAGDAYLAPGKMPPPKYFDTAILTILALCVLRGEVAELPETGAIAGYRAFTRGLTEMPERRIEVPGLDEDARRILQEAGVDPDQLQNGYVDNSFRDAKEESEARAAELFEEKQRLAQLAVKEKLARGVAEEDRHTSVNPEDFTQEKLRLSDDDDETGDEGRRSYADFFKNDDEIDESARRANDENDDAEPEAPHETKDFGAFFDGSDEDERREFEDDDQADAPADPVPARDFSAFFSGGDEEDESIRAHVEEEDHAAADTGHNYASFFDDLDEKAIPEFDDGSGDIEKDEQKDDAPAYTADFFSEEKKPLSGLKMTLDEPEPEPAAEEEKQVPAAPAPQYVPSVEDNSPRRDFTKLFDDSIPAPTLGLRMAEDDAENAAKIAAAEKQVPAAPAPEYEPSVEDDSPRRDFTKLFDDSIPAPTLGLRMAEDDAENAAKIAAARKKFSAGGGISNADDDMSAETESPARDFSHMFDDEERAEVPGMTEAERAREEQIRELEAEQARRAAIEAEQRPHKLKLALDGSEHEVQAAESYQQRMTRLIAEKQAAAREQALREREEDLRELEELKKQGPKTPVVEHLQLSPTYSDDPDEQVKKVAPEDLVIKGFAYDDLDMIHANTADADDIEDDFDMYAAVAQHERDEAAKNNPQHSSEKTDKADSGDLDDVLTGSVRDNDSSPK